MRGFFWGGGEVELIIFSPQCYSGTNFCKASGEDLKYLFAHYKSFERLGFSVKFVPFGK